MRLAASAIAALLLLIAAPTEAPAQKLGHIFGPLVRPIDSLLRRGGRKILRPYAYRPRGRVARSYANRTRTRAIRSPAIPGRAVAQTQDQVSPQQLMLAQSAQPKPFWPDAPQNIFDYILLQKDAGLREHGYGAIVASMFAQPHKDDARGAASAAANNEQTAGTAASGAIVCGERSLHQAEEVTKQIAGALALADDQKNILTGLRSALRQAEEEIIAACPSDVPATLPERLRSMQDRLWAVRVAATNLRMPLHKFHETLTREQKTQLDAQHLSPGDKSDAMPTDAAKLCYAMTQRAPQWPAVQIARIGRLNKGQQVALATLSETSSQMNQLMMGSCPQTTPATMARLDATLDWIDAMLFAGVNMAVAVDDFYRSLSDEQKTKLDKLDL